MVKLTLASAALLIGGCAVGNLIGGMAQNLEYQKLVDTPPKYNGLEDRTIAVIVDTDLSMLYEYPDLGAKVAAGVSARIDRDVPGSRVLSPKIVIGWQYLAPQWSSLPYGEVCAELNVDRIVMIEILEYRLTPPGNRYLWDGTATARIGIIERDGLDPDIFAESFDVTAKFPNLEGVSRDDANARQIETGLLAEFIKKTAWIFHQHLEPKYPDKYRPELDR
jgi:hypothetical protein